MRLIDADALYQKALNLGDSEYHTHASVYRSDVEYIIEDAPTVDAELVKHGHWIKNEWGEQTCSCCQGIVCKDTETCIAICQYDYCPGCGAKMDEEGENV